MSDYSLNSSVFTSDGFKKSIILQHVQGFVFRSFPIDSHDYFTGIGSCPVLKIDVKWNEGIRVRFHIYYRTLYHHIIIFIMTIWYSELTRNLFLKFVMSLLEINWFFSIANVYYIIFRDFSTHILHLFHWQGFFYSIWKKYIFSKYILTCLKLFVLISFVFVGFIPRYAAKTIQKNCVYYNAIQFVQRVWRVKSARDIWMYSTKKKKKFTIVTTNKPLSRWNEAVLTICVVSGEF